MNIIERFQIPGLSIFYISKEYDRYEVCCGGSFIGGTGWEKGYGDKKGFATAAQAREFIHFHARRELDCKIANAYNLINKLKESKLALGEDSFFLAKFLVKID